ncbi:MAG: hypothetical protein VW277_01230 [Candidatus Neomarinimicrobiota bacterium]
MKNLLIIILFVVGCSTDNIEKNIPKFDSNRAFQHLVDQCNFGPRSPGSNGHKDFSNYLEEYLTSLSSELITQEFSYLEHLTNIESLRPLWLLKFLI